MDDIEACLLVGNLLLAGYLWLRWYVPLLLVTRLASDSSLRTPLAVVPLICVVIVFLTMQFFAAWDVQNNFIYVMFYTVMGLVWVGLMNWVMPFMGISPREDVIERGNRAALYAVVGALFGLTFAFSGGNIGNGPGWWAVVHSAGLATLGFFLVWQVLEGFSGVAYVVTVDRDLAAGLRLGGFLIAVGLVLGYAATGDWYTFGQMTDDFLRRAWPALVLLAAAVVVERASRPTEDRPVLPVFVYGVVPAVLYVAAAGLFLSYVA